MKKGTNKELIQKKETNSTYDKKTLLLDGLCCPNCSLKIEKEIKNIPGVKSASLDFVSKKLSIETNKEDLHKVVDKTTKIIKSIESDINVIEEESTQKHESIDHMKNKIILFALGSVLFFFPLIFNAPFWVEFFMLLTSYILVGGKVLLKALRNILKGQVFDENFLMSVATIGAFAIKEFPEGVAVMLFYQIGEFFQDVAVNRSRKSIEALMDIRPDYANLKRGDEVKKVPPNEVSTGDIIIIKPGEKIPLDGKVIEGTSMLDTSPLTGESLPRKVQAGMEVLSGSVNLNGLLTLKVTKEFSQSTVSKILELVQNASSRKAPTENFITRFARYYTPFVVFIATALAIIPPLIIPGATFAQWINRGLVFLVVSCPCALVVSIPLGFFGGIGGASKNGILVKGGNYLEALNNIDTVVFDKTGTLTKGVFNVTQITSKSPLSHEQLLEYGAYAQSYSNHPIALSIMKAYGKNIDKSEVSNYNEIPGHGIKATVKGKVILIGNSNLMKMENITFEETQATGTLVYIAIDSMYSGFIIISDQLKDDSQQTIKSLKNMGIKKIVMLTGDNKTIGQKIAHELELDQVYAQLLPHQKVEKLEMLDKEKTSKGKLVFVGDGINDAPVLARADIGVAMGGIGSDAAIEAADIVLMTDQPSKLVTAIKIAKRTRNIVWQNIIFSMAIKGVVLLLGAGGIATMWEAVFADVGVAVLAVLNSMRVMKDQS